MQPWKAEFALILRPRTREPVRVGSAEVIPVVCIARTLPRGLIVSACQPSIFISCPTNSLPSGSVTPTACTEYLLSNTEAEISCWKEYLGPKWPGRRRVFLMCVYVCTQDTSHRLCKQAVPSPESSQGFQQQKRKTRTEQKQSLQPSPGTWELNEDQICVTGTKMFYVFSHLFPELVQSFLYTLTDNLNNFLLEIGGRAEQRLTN